MVILAPRILVVDDDDGIREFVSWALCDEGYEVMTAAHGAAALEVTEGWKPDVILLDMRMPTMDGWEFSRIYRQRPGPHAAIIVITAAHDGATRAEEISAEGFIGKPFELSELLEVIRRYDKDLGFRG